MLAVIDNKEIKGTVTAPASKSMMQRACAAALLHKGRTIIRNPGHSADDKAVLEVILRLGAQVQFLETGDLAITSTGIIPGNTSIHVGESGLAARLFIPIAATADAPIEITGSGSLLSRPMETFKDILPQLGVKVETSNGYLPFTVTGPLQPKDITIDGSMSSQFLSGLLFAYCFAAKEPVVIKVTDLKSKSYIDLTIDVLRAFGHSIMHCAYKEFHITPARQHKEEVEITIEGDWSNAAYWLVAGAIGGDVTVKGLNIHSRQADQAILEVLDMVGADITQDNDTIRVTKTDHLNAIDFDATDSPDMFPVLSILAACCDGESNLTGIHRLYHKESNRAVSISEMLDQFGVQHSFDDDILSIEGGYLFEATHVDSYNDHRIAMAAAIGALRAYGVITIHNAEAVNKSYPAFYKDLTSLGINCSFKEE